MQSKHSNAAAPPSFNPGHHTGQTLVEAQQTAMEMAAKLSALAFKYALELNKIGFELWQTQIQHYAGLSDRLAPPQTPQQVLSAHAELIERAAKDYEEGVQRIANAGQDMVRETAQTLDEGREHAETLIEKTANRAQKPAVRPRANGSRGRSGR